MSRVDAIPLIAILAFILVTLILGILPYGRKRIDTLKSFHTAAGNVRAPIIFLCLMATVFTSSTWTAWVTFSANTGVFALYCAAYIVATGIVYFFIVQKVYPIGKDTGVLTMSGLMREKFQSGSLGYVVALISVVIGCFWIIMEITTLGIVVNVIVNGKLSAPIAMSIGLVVVLVYILWGGLESVIWTSCFQGSIITIGGIVLSIVLFSYFFDSFGEFWTAFSAHEEFLTMDNSEGSATSVRLWTSYVILGTAGCVCLPQVFSRMFMGKSVRSQKVAAIGLSGASVWCLFFTAIGFMAIAIDLSRGSSDSLVFTMIEMTDNIYLLSFTYILLIAASMGTLDITLVSVSTILTYDLAQPLLKGKRMDVSQFSYIRMSRIFILAVAVVCVLGAMFYTDELINLALNSYEFTVQLFPILIMACYSKYRNAFVAFLALICGTLVLSVLSFTDVLLFGFTAGFWGLVANGAVIFVYLLIKRSRKEIPGPNSIE